MKSEFNKINQINLHIFQKYIINNINFTYQKSSWSHNRSKQLDLLTIYPSTPRSGIRV